MRSVALRFSALALPFVALTLPLAGCATGEEPSPDVPEQHAGLSDAGVSLLPPSAPATGAHETDMTGDAGPRLDAGVDSGPAPPLPGDPCPTIDETFTRSCGACGKQSAICTAEGGGGPRVSDYSACAGERVDGCIPGTAETLPCGNCGTQTRTCTASCAWSTTACAEPPAACKPGAIELSTAGCAGASTMRQRTCGTSCAWSAFGACAAAPFDLVVDLPPAGTATVVPLTIPPQRTLPRSIYSMPCPLSHFEPVETPSAAVLVRNLIGKMARFSISVRRRGSTITAHVPSVGYAGPIDAWDESARKACTRHASDAHRVDVAPGESFTFVLQPGPNEGANRDWDVRLETVQVF